MSESWFWSIPSLSTITQLQNATITQLQTPLLLTAGSHRIHIYSKLAPCALNSPSSDRIYRTGPRNHYHFQGCRNDISKTALRDAAYLPCATSTRQSLICTQQRVCRVLHTANKRRQRWLCREPFFGHMAMSLRCAKMAQGKKNEYGYISPEVRCSHISLEVMKPTTIKREYLFRAHFQPRMSFRARLNRLSAQQICCCV